VNKADVEVQGLCRDDTGEDLSDISIYVLSDVSIFGMKPIELCIRPVNKDKHIDQKPPGTGIFCQHFPMRRLSPLLVLLTDVCPRAN
jgi:hypothetical protein